MNDFVKIRDWSRTILNKAGIPLNPNLPILDSLQLRSKEEIAERLVIQYALAGIADDVSPEFLKDWLSENGLYPALSDYDRHFLETKTLSSEEINELSWKQESLWTLCWIGLLVDELGLPIQECDLSEIFQFLPPDVEYQKFLSDFSVRNTLDIFRKVDLYYCLHSSYVHPELWDKNTFPDGLKIEVLLERRLALEWAVDPNTPWHEISLDT